MNENVKISNGVKKLLLFISFIAGYLIMSLELLGFRLLAPYFGNSIYVWGSLVGLILAALSAGYYFGGWLIEKWPQVRAVTGLFGVVAIFLLFTLFFYQPILKYLAQWDIISGSLAATFLIFGVPMIALAAVSPVVIKILAEQEKTGRSAGLVYAWATLGSLLGTFLTAFVLIPYFGSRLTLYSCFFLVLIVLAILFLVHGHKNLLVIGLFFFISLFGLRSAVLPANVIFETESAYNQIRLIDTKNLILLTLNSQRYNLLQSVYVKEGTLFNLSLIDLFNVGPAIAPVKNLLILGMAGGASVRQFQQFFPETRIDAVEIDPKIIDIAKERFGVKENENLKIFEADARPFLAKSQKKYDMVEVDLFQGGPYAPFYTLTQEFFKSIFSHLTDEGLLMMNIYAPRGQEILAPALATINSVFPSVFTIPINDNFVVLATKSETDLEAVKNKIEAAQKNFSSDLILPTNYASDLIEKYQPDKKTPVFTDDWAPVELLTYRMLKGLKL